MVPKLHKYRAKFHAIQLLLDQAGQHQAGAQAAVSEVRSRANDAAFELENGCLDGVRTELESIVDKPWPAPLEKAVAVLEHICGRRTDALILAIRLPSCRQNTPNNSLGSLHTIRA